MYLVLALALLRLIHTAHDAAELAEQIDDDRLPSRPIPRDGKARAGLPAGRQQISTTGTNEGSDRRTLMKTAQWRSEHRRGDVEATCDRGMTAAAGDYVCVFDQRHLLLDDASGSWSNSSGFG